MTIQNQRVTLLWWNSQPPDDLFRFRIAFIFAGLIKKQFLSLAIAWRHIIHDESQMRSLWSENLIGFLSTNQLRGSDSKNAIFWIECTWKKWPQILHVGEIHYLTRQINSNLIFSKKQYYFADPKEEFAFKSKVNHFLSS